MKMILRYLAVPIILLTASLGFAQNTVWSGTVTLDSSYTIPAGDTLTIDPGTWVQLASGVSITADGVMKAVGTASQRISFTSTGSWGSIVFSDSGADNSIMDYCNVYYGTEIELSYANNVTIENSSIMNSSSYGIYVYFSSDFVAQSDSIANSNVYHGIIITGGSSNNCYWNVTYKTNKNQQGAGILYSGSSGTVGGNDVDYYNWGIAAIWGASPNADEYPLTKNNRVDSCQLGLNVYYNSYCDFGVGGASGNYS